MAQIAVQPIIMKHASLAFAHDNYEGHVSSAALVPSSSVVNWKGLSPTSTFSFPTSSTWVCNLTLAQDWETANSLANYLFDHEGDTVPVVFAPDDGGQAWDVNLIVVPGQIGGEVDTVPTAQVSLGVQGRPTRHVKA